MEKPHSHENIPDPLQPDPSDLAAAANVEHPHAQLARLAASHHPEIRRAAAENPNTPAQTLFTLWLEFPEAMPANPIIALWDFHDPGWIEARCTPEMAAHLYLFFAGRNYDTTLGAPFEPNHRRRLVGICLRQFHAHAAAAALRDPHPPIRKDVLPHAQKLPTDRLLAIAAIPACRDLFCQLLNAFSRNPAADPFGHDHIDCLLGHADREIRLGACSLHRISHASLLRLCRDPDPAIRTAVASNTQYADIQKNLAADPDESIRATLAASPRLTEAGGLLLMADPSPAVRHTLAANPKAPVRVLDRFSIHQPLEILAALLTNPATSKRKLFFVLQNAPPELETTHPEARHRAARSLKADRNYKHTKEFRKELFEFLARDRDPRLRLFAAEKFPTAKETLITLASDPCEKVRATAQVNLKRFHRYP